MNRTVNQNVGRNWSRKSLENLIEGYLKDKGGGDIMAINYFAPFEPQNSFPGAKFADTSANFNYLCFLTTPLTRNKNTSLGYGYYTVESDAKTSTRNNKGISGVGTFSNSKGERFYFSILTKPRVADFGSGNAATGASQYFVINPPLFEGAKNMNYPPFYQNGSLVGDDEGALYDYGQWNKSETAAVVAAVEYDHYMLYTGSPNTYEDSEGDDQWIHINKREPKVYIFKTVSPGADTELAYFGNLVLYTTNGSVGTRPENIKVAAQKTINQTVTTHPVSEIRNNRTAYPLPVPGLNTKVMTLTPSILNAEIQSAYNSVKSNTPGKATGRWNSEPSSVTDTEFPYRFLSTIIISPPSSGRTMSDAEKEFYIWCLTRKFCEVANDRSIRDIFTGTDKPQWGTEVPIIGTNGTSTITYTKVDI